MIRALVMFFIFRLCERSVCRSNFFSFFRRSDVIEQTNEQCGNLRKERARKKTKKSEINFSVFYFIAIIEHVLTGVLVPSANVLLIHTHTHHISHITILSFILI